MAELDLGTAKAVFKPLIFTGKHRHTGCDSSATARLTRCWIELDEVNGVFGDLGLKRNVPFPLLSLCESRVKTDFVEVRQTTARE